MNRFTEYLTNLDTCYYKNDEGWNFGTFPPELLKYSREIIKPGGTAFIAGVGDSGLPTFLVANGMSVESIDLESTFVDQINETGLQYDLPMRSELLDVLVWEPKESSYDFIDLNSLFVHFTSLDDIHSVINKCFKALKPSGTLWIRTGSKICPFYNQLKAQVKYQPQRQYVKDGKAVEDVFNVTCGCTGTVRVEPIIFVDPGLMMHHLYETGFNIIHSQTMTEEYNTNIMYGEDWPMPTQMVSFLLKKP